MSFGLSKEYPRLWSLNSGVAMIVTDLHGDWETYQSYRDHFLDLHSKGKADYLVFTGDLIHSESKDFPDQSVEIVLDVIYLRLRFGDAIIYLCGNHELPHIYGYGLTKGQTEYTPAFEQQMKQKEARTKINELFLSLPFFIRTAAGVSITHAGAAPMISNFNQASSLFTWDHQDILAEARAKLSESDPVGMRRAYAKLSQADSYGELALKYLVVKDMHDPRYDDLLLGFLVTSNHKFDLLYSALSTACEQEFGAADYETALHNLLQYLSTDYPTQHILVSGHMTVKNGYQVVTQNHLRIASGAHAKPLQSGRYLLFDTARPVESTHHLMEDIFPIP